MGKLDGRIAVVTGAGRGIGASVARMMAREGAAVVVNDLGANVDGTGGDDSPAQQVVKDIKAAGGRAVANFADISNHDAAEGLIRTALDEFGGLDVLVNVAGILRDRMIFNMSEPDWDAVINVHLKGTFNTSRFASIYWRQARKGNYRLINFTSVAGLYGAPGQPNYAAAKLGIVGLTYSCANALARYGVTSNAISPGANTRMVGTIPTDRLAALRSDGEAEADAAAAKAAELERSPDNVAPAVIYLASEQSSWMTGRVVGANGYRISLFSNPEVISEIATTGPWQLDDAFARIEQTFKPAIEGSNMYSRMRMAQAAAATTGTQG